MSRLSKLRRWVNMTRVDQGFFDRLQGSYVHVKPGHYLEGAQWTHANMSPLTETTAHFAQEELSQAVHEEDDPELLRHLLEVERQGDQRVTVVRLFENRLRELRDRAADRCSDTTSDPSRNGRTDRPNASEQSEQKKPPSRRRKTAQQRRGAMLARGVEQLRPKFQKAVEILRAARKNWPTDRNRWESELRKEGITTQVYIDALLSSRTATAAAAKAIARLNNLDPRTVQNAVSRSKHKAV
jgi:hypothetical protein